MRLREIRESDAQVKGESAQISSDTAQKSKQKRFQNRRTLPLTGRGNRGTKHRNGVAAMSSEQASQWLTAGEAARHLKIEPRTLLLWARQGKVKGYILSGTDRVTWRFLRSDLDAKLVPPTVALNRRIQ
jgi:Helix-turn-helix domain